MQRGRTSRILCDTELVCNPLKMITERPRPTEKFGSGRFWKGGYGFPSGHSMKAWALVSALIHKFPQRRILRALAYGIAGTVSLSRIFGFRHFASDAFVGAVMGWYIGAFVQTRRRSGAYPPECLKILNNQPLQRMNTATFSACVI